MPKANSKVAKAAQKKPEETPNPWEATEQEATPDQDPKRDAPPAPDPKPAPSPKPTPTGNGLVNLTGLDETTEKVNVLLYGREGSGKTTAAVQAANRGRVLVVNAEGGLKPTALRNLGVDTSNIAVWPQNGAHEVTYAGLEAIHQQVKTDLEQDPESWYAVIVDSLTELTAALTDRVSSHRVDKTRARGVLVDEMDAWNTDRNDFGIVTKQTRDFVRKMRDLPCHLIMTALERRDVDEDSGMTSYGPNMPPAIQKDVLGYMDLVLYLREASDDKPYRAATKHAGKYRAKDRFGVLPRVLEDPSFPRIEDFVNGDLVEDETTD